MTTEDAIKLERTIEVILNKDVPIASRSLTTNTSIYSIFIPYNTITYIKRGSIKLYNNKDIFYAEAGECFFTIKYADYKAERYLDEKSKDYESITFFINELDFKNEDLTTKIHDYEKEQLNFKIKSNALKEDFQIIDQNFNIQEVFSDTEINNLTSRIAQVVLLTSKKQLLSLLNGRDNHFLSFLHQHITLNLTLEQLAQKYGMSTSSFYRLFIKKIGVSPHKWIKDKRLHFAHCYMLFTKKPFLKFI